MTGRPREDLSPRHRRAILEALEREDRALARARTILPKAIRAALEDGASAAEIGRLLGLTRQAVSKRAREAD